MFNLQPDQDDHVLNLQFSWHGLVKPVGSAFIGTSPEFEMAIFTIIFLMNTERSTTVLVNIDQCQMELVVIRHGRSLGTAYPRLLSSNSRHISQATHWSGESFDSQQMNRYFCGSVTHIVVFVWKVDDACCRPSYGWRSLSRKISHSCFPKYPINNKTKHLWLFFVLSWNIYWSTVFSFAFQTLSIFIDYK